MASEFLRKMAMQETQNTGGGQIASSFLREKAAQEQKKTVASAFLQNKVKEAGHLQEMKNGQERETTPAVPEQGYYAMPSLGGDAERLMGIITGYEQSLNGKKSALESAQKAVTDTQGLVEFWENHMKLLEQSYKEESSDYNAELLRKGEALYGKAVEDYRNAYGNYSILYEDYMPEYGAYEAAVKDYQKYIEEQKAQYDAWKQRIRDAEQVKTEMDSVEKEIKKAQSTESGNTLRNMASAFASAVGGGPASFTPVQSVDNAKRLEELQEKYRLLREEYDWAQRFAYDKIREEPDFEEKSGYVSTANGKEKLNPLYGVYTNNGFDDITYDYINGNEIARNRQSVNDIQSNAAILGFDNRFLQQMTVDEVKLFNYLYATKGRDEAFKYISYLSGSLNQRQRQQEELEWQDFADKHPVGSSVLSVLESPMKGMSYLGQMADYLSDGRIDQNAGYNRFSYINSAMREQVAKKIEGSGKWGKIGSFAYQTGMSMGDFLLNTAITGGLSGGGAVSEALSLAIMGTGAAADATISAKDRGIADEKAFALGTIAGMAEIITEKVSIDTLLDADLLAEGSLKYILKNALSEGTEEVGSDVINLVADVLISRGKSEWQQAIEKYRKEGKSDKEAFGLAVADQAAQMGLDFLGGALSGGIMAGVSAGVQSHRTGSIAQDLQAAELSKEDVQTFLDTGMESDADTSAYKLAQKLQQKVDAGGTVTQEELARQYQANILAVEEENARLQDQARETEEKAGNNETSTLAMDQKAVNEEQRTGGIQNGTNENQYTEYGRTGLSDGGKERNAGTGAGEQDGKLAEGAKRGSADLSAIKTANQRQNTARSLRSQVISTAELGLRTGTDTRNIRVLPEEGWDAELRQTAQRVSAETGMPVTFVIGKMNVRGKSGKVAEVRGAIAGGQIYVQADNTKVSAGKIADHEIFHAKADTTPGLVSQIHNKITEQYSREQMEKVLDKYIDAMYGIIDMEADPEEGLRRIEEEIFADAYAGINAFGANAGQFSETVDAVLERRGVGRIREQENGTKQTNGPPAERYSIDTAVDETAEHSESGTALPDADRAYGGDESIYKPVAELYYGEGRKYDGKAIAVFSKARNKPEELITVYRAVPKNIMDTRLRNGDWVSPTREYAVEHGERTFEDGYRIIKEDVPAKHLYVNGDSIHEFGYDNGRQDEAYKNTRNNVKLQGVTYDENGTLIPLSSRYDEENPDVRYSVEDEERKERIDRIGRDEIRRMNRRTEQKEQSKPTIARRELKQQLLNLFSVPEGQRTLIGTIVDAAADRMLKNGALTEDDRRRLFNKLYEAGVMNVEADPYYAEGRNAIAGGKIYVPESVKAEFGDDWNAFRKKAFASGVYLTGNKSDYGIDMWNMELAEQLPGLFDIDETDRKEILERIIQIAEDGKDEKLSLPDYTRRLAMEQGVTEDQFLDSMERQMDSAIRTFAEKASLEVKLKDRTERLLAEEREKSKQRVQAEYLREAAVRAKERDERKQMAKRQREAKELRELQQKTLKQLRWLKQNQFRAPEELKGPWEEVLGDIDIFAVSAANEMNWSDKYNATWKDIAQMYKDAKEYDPNFLPSEELKKIVERLDGRKIADMDPGALEDLYKAAVALRTEFYNRNNVINDENHRIFEEVFDDVKEELEGAARGSSKNTLDRFMNLEQLTPMNVMERMAGWNPDSTFYAMAKQLERGERDIRAYKVKANRMLQGFLTENEAWVKRADGQGDDATWYEITVPELMELNMGDKPVFGDTVTVFMTPSQKVHLYLESKNTDNLRHMTGGRTFPDKELYSQGKREEAFAQGRTIRLAPETVKAIVKDLTPEEMELANILEQYYNQFAKLEINRISNILYGYDKAMGKNYAPIYTNKNYTKSEFGIFDVTAEGVGNLKGRQYAVNPSLNISAFDAFERHTDQTARFVGMAIPERNWTTLMNWRVKNNSTGDVITHAWGDEGKKYITDLITSLQSGERIKKDSVSGSADKLLSNYITAVFGANPSIVLKQLGSIPLASVYLGSENIPGVTQIRNIDRNLIGKYTQDLEWRTMGYSMPETAMLKENPGWYRSNKVLSFIFGGDAITAMDGWAASVLWPWAENKVRRQFPELETGTREQIDAGESPFYKKVAEEFEDAVARSQSTSDEIHQSLLRKSKNQITRAFTMFRSDSAQTYNAIRQKIGEAQYLMKHNGEPEKIRTAKRAAGYAFLTAIIGYTWAEAVEFLMNLWKHKGKKYRDDEDELTAESVFGEMVQGLIGDMAGIVAGGEELYDIIGNILTGEKWYGLSTPGMEQLGDVVDAAVKAGKGLRDIVADGWELFKAGGDVPEYYRRNGNKILGQIKDFAQAVSTYFVGIPVNNLEAYLMGLVRWVSPEIGTAYDDLLQTAKKQGLKGLEGDALTYRVGSILRNRKASDSEETAKALADLYAAGETGAIPTETPGSISFGGNNVELDVYQKQLYEKVWSSTVSKTLDEIVASDSFRRADDKGKADLVKGLYTLAAERAKAEILDGYEISGSCEKIRQMEAVGISITDALLWNSATKEMKTGEKMNALTQWHISDRQKKAVIGTILGTETETEAGNPTQYAKFRKIMDGGLSVDDYLEMYISGASMDKYMSLTASGMDPKAAADAMTEFYDVRKTFDADGNGSYSNSEIKAAIDAIGGDPEQRILAQILGQELPDDLGLTNEQKAKLWQILTGSSSAKNNPYSAAAGQEVLDAKRESSTSFADEVMRQLMGG